MSGDRPAPTERPAPRRNLEPGGFRVRSDPDPHYRVAIEVSWDELGKPDAIRKQLTEAFGLAFAELDKRTAR